MGWFGYGVFDGDTPSACRTELFEIMNVSVEVRDYEGMSTENVASWEGISRDMFKKMFRKCNGIGYNYDELEHSAAMTVLVEFACQNNVSVPADMCRKIRKPIQKELDNIADMGWDEPHKRKRTLRNSLRKFDQHTGRHVNPSTGEVTYGIAIRSPRRLSEWIAMAQSASMTSTVDDGFRRFELVNRARNISKFWEVKRNSRGWDVRYGRIGWAARTSTKVGTRYEMTQLINRKLRKGYREVTVP